VSRTGYPSYAGVVTYWWTGRAPSESDAAIADLMVKHLIGQATIFARDRALSLAGSQYFRFRRTGLIGSCFHHVILWRAVGWR
jgi:hypothetical protein